MEKPIIKRFKPKNESWYKFHPGKTVEIPTINIKNGLIMWNYDKEKNGWYEYNHKKSVYSTARMRHINWLYINGKL